MKSLALTDNAAHAAGTNRDVQPGLALASHTVNQPRYAVSVMGHDGHPKLLLINAVSTLAGSPYPNGSADGRGRNAEFSAPSGAALDSLGRLYVADTGNSTIRLITTGLC